MSSNTAVAALDIEASDMLIWPLTQMKRANDNFPWNEMRRYIEDKNTSNRRTTPIFFDRALEQWKKYMAINTPPYGFSCSPFEPFLDYVNLLLSAMSFVLDSKDPRHAATAALQMAPIWPSIWTWLRTFRDHSAQARSLTAEDDEAVHCKLRYHTVIKMLHLIIRVHSDTPLGTLATETEGFLEAIATLWIEEGNDIAGTNGFSSSILIQSHPSGIPSSLILEQIVANCGSSTNAAYRVLISRIKNNLKQVKPDFASFNDDTTIIMEQLHAGDTDSPASAILPILQQEMSSNPMFAPDMVDILMLLLAIKAPAPATKHMHVPLLIILTHFQRCGYHCVFQLLTTRIINLVAILHSRYGSDKQVLFTSVQLLENVIGRYLIYRPLLYPVAGSALEVLDAYEEKVPSGRVGQALITLQERLVDWTEIDMKYKKLEHQYRFDCGNPHCTVSDDLCKGVFRRCSGCLLVQYCSEACQKKHWQEQHKRLCSLKGHPNREAVGLSGPGLRYLTHVVVHECMGLTPQQRSPFAKDLSSDTARTSILLLDYERPERGRVCVEVLDIEDPAVISRLAKSAPEFHLTEDWRRCWETASLVSAGSQHLRSVMPVMALFPRGWSDPQVMTGIFALHSPIPGEESGLDELSSSKPHIRWLHRF